MLKSMTIAATTFLIMSTTAEAKIHNRISHDLHREITSGEVMATYYGPRFYGHKTASGERFNAYGLTAAHGSLPFGTIVQVFNPRTRRHCQVRINDRGVGPGKLDLSVGAAKSIGIFEQGTGRVFIKILSSKKNKIKTGK